jgi:hypothetical protein
MKVVSDVLLLSYLHKFDLWVTVEAGQALACSAILLPINIHNSIKIMLILTFYVLWEGGRASVEEE